MIYLHFINALESNTLCTISKLFHFTNLRPCWNRDVGCSGSVDQGEKSDERVKVFFEVEKMEKKREKK
jgi:hypothetical protein